MIKQRLITAIILIALIASLLFCLPAIYWLGFTLLMTALAAWEWSSLFLKKNPLPAWTSVAFALAITALAYGAMTTLAHNTLYGATVLMTLWGFIGIKRYSSSKQSHQAGLHDPILALLLSVWLLIPFLSAMNDIVTAPHGSWVLLYAMSIVWVNDSMAYATGKLFGKHKLIPAVSPNKTWEGLLGGLAFALTWGVLLGLFVVWPHMHYGWSFALLVALLTLSANVGDLLMSLLKRLAKKKDTSNLLPGHGGVLDRIDSLLTAMPLFALGCNLLGLISH